MSNPTPQLTLTDDQKQSLAKNGATWDVKGRFFIITEDELCAFLADYLPREAVERAIGQDEVDDGYEGHEDVAVRNDLRGDIRTALGLDDRGGANHGSK